MIDGLSWLLFGYFVGLHGVYLLLCITALHLISRDAADRRLAALAGLGAGLEPGVSVVVPAFNEGRTIAASVRSLLQVDYPDHEVIVVNDGSTDDTLAVLVREFGLVPFPEALRRQLPVQPVAQVLRAPRFPRLRVIDKANGGRSDALNAGLNAAQRALVCFVDADSVLMRDSLRQLVRPMLQDPRVVACGGTVRLSNGCRVARGVVERIDVPRSWLARVQVVEYLRSFLYGRIGWGLVNGLPIISGAFGLFRRADVVAAGGLSVHTIGEDMELVLRLHLLMRDRGQPYRIVAVPEAVCWTEAPERLAVLRVQRQRWQRGLMESLWANRRLFGRGGVGGLAMPFLLLFEGIGPLVELAGYLVMALLVAGGQLSPAAFGAFLLLAVGLGMLLSTTALLLDEIAFGTYPRLAHLGQLVLAIAVEGLGYRQLNAAWRVAGLWQWATRRRPTWGVMTRLGAQDRD